MEPFRRVVIESPYGSRPDGSRATPAEVAENAEYLRRCMRDSLSRGEAPFASHGLYPQVLDEQSHDDRMRGILAGFSWGERAELVAVYMDRGFTPGMAAGVTNYEGLGIPVERRWLEPVSA